MKADLLSLSLNCFWIIFHGIGLFLLNSPFSIFPWLNRFYWSSQQNMISCLWYFVAVPWKRSWRTRWLNFRLVVRCIFSLEWYFSPPFVLTIYSEKLFADSTGNNSSRIPGDCWEACLYRFEPSLVLINGYLSAVWSATFSWEVVNLFESPGFMIFSDGHKSWWRGEVCSILKIPK